MLRQGNWGLKCAASQDRALKLYPVLGGGVKLVKCRKKSKKPQPNLSLNITVRKLAS